jgi:branched-chain amino acid transport system permease protein
METEHTPKTRLSNMLPNLLHKYGWIMLVGVVLILLVLPLLELNTYLMNILVKVGIYTILGLGLNVLVGYTGLVSLGQAGFVAIGAYTTTILTKQFGVDFFLAALLGALLAGFFGLLIGLPSLRLKGTYLSIITLGFGEIIRTIIIVWQPVTNGPLGIRNIPSPELFGTKLTLYNGGLFYLVLALLILVTLFCQLLINTKMGRAMRAIKGDETAAIMMGVNVTYYKIAAFIIAAVISGLAGSIFATQLGYIDQNTFTFDMSTLILSIVILGGMGTVRGMFVGALLLVVFPEIARPLMDYRFVFYGLILVLMMRFRPQGLLGWKDTTPFPVSKNAFSLFSENKVAFSKKLKSPLHSETRSE